MTNVNADSANDTGLPATKTQMTRCQMQTEALIIESLLAAAQALFGSTDSSEMIGLVEMATDRASRLNRALDSVNLPKVAL